MTSHGGAGLAPDSGGVTTITVHMRSGTAHWEIILVCRLLQEQSPYRIVGSDLMECGFGHAPVEFLGARRERRFIGVFDSGAEGTRGDWRCILVLKP